MAKRASIATGNFTAAGTWGLIDATMYGQSETSQPVCATSYGTATRSALYTPGAITVSHIGIKLANRTGTTGTITVHIANNAHVEVAGTAVTINCADLPAATNTGLNGGWHFFKLATPVTLAAATQYEVEAKTSSASQIQLHASATTNGLSCALLDAATTGAPAAGDDLFVVGEYTGTGTSNSFTVTMDNTATTDFGSAPTAANSLLGPGIAICNKGTLTFGSTAATNYYLKVSNSVIVYSGGTFNIGTTGTPIPRDSTAVLEFDPAADGNYGLVVRNLGTFNAQGLSRTSGKDVVMCKLNTDEAAAQTTLGVDTDTGWLNGDEIVIASTTRTASQTEKRTLNADANASDMTVSSGLTNAHSGTSPTQAEVALLTRNVKIRSATSTLVIYLTFANSATADLDWVEIYYLGEVVGTDKEGIVINTTTGSFSMQYCSIHDTEDGGLKTGSSATNITISNNIFYNIATVAGASAYPIRIGTGTTSGTVFDSNLIMTITAMTSSSSSGAKGALCLFSPGATITNNTIVSCTSTNSAAMAITGSRQTIGTISGNTIHSCASAGIQFASASTVHYSPIGTISTLKIWRCNDVGIVGSIGAATTSQPIIMDGLIFDTCTLFGNTTANIHVNDDSQGTAVWESGHFKDCLIDSDSSFSTTNGVLIGGTGSSKQNKLTFGGCSFGNTTAHTNDFNFSTGYGAQIELSNTKLASGTEVTGLTGSMVGSYLRSEKHDQTTGLHKTLKYYGNLTIDTGTVHTGSQSMKLTPNSASFKLESSSFYIAVANGATLTPSVYVYEDASYNGARARLILKRNDAIGITSDTVIDTATASSDGAWEELTGTTDAATDDGVMEFIIDCDGTAGNLFVDSFTVA